MRLTCCREGTFVGDCVKMKKIFFTWNGLGDNLALVGAAFNYFLKTGEKALLGVPFNCFNDLFEYADFVDWCTYSSMSGKRRRETMDLCAKKNLEPIFITACGYKWLLPDFEYNINYWHRKHLILRYSERMGLDGDVQIRIPIRKDYPTSGNSSFLQNLIKSRYVCIMTGGVQNYKAVKVDVMQGIVNAYKEKFKFIQLGSKKDLVLSDVVDCRGTSLVDSISLLQNAQFLITATGGLTHLAAVSQCKAFVLQTGGEPLQIGFYLANRYVTAVDNCGICARNWRDPQHQPCFYHYKCIRNLTSERAVKALENELSYLMSSGEYGFEVLKASSEPANGLEDYFSHEKTLKFEGGFFSC